ncbi:MAG: hypothetical protein HYU28_09585 [Actinobacteria bacterium]|nr:hypothetical protein [Actinomycetota bacterium]
MRVIAILPFALSLALLALAVATVRREGRVKPRSDVVRLIIAAGTALLVGAAMSVSTPGGVVIGATLAGVVVGAIQGANLQVRLTPGGVFTRRGVVAVTAWALGTGAAQLAGIANRADAVRLGLTVSFFSAGLTLGLMIGRSRAIENARATASTASAAVLAVVLGVGVLVGGGTPSRAAAQTGPACPGSLAGVPLAESKPREEPERGTHILSCRWEYTTTEEGVLYGFGFASADVEWSVPPKDKFYPCLLKAGEVFSEANPNGGGGRNGRVISATHYLRGSFFESGGDRPFAGGEGEAAMKELMAAAEPLAAPCVPEGTGSGLECSPSVGGYPNSYSSQFDMTDEGEAKETGFSCNFSPAYGDVKGTGTVTVGWTEGPIADDQGYTRCGNPPTTGGSSHYLDSQTRAANATYSIQDGMPIGPLEAEARRLLSAAEALAAPCPNQRETAAGADAGTSAGSGNEGEPSGTDEGDGGDDEGEIDPSSALGGALIGLLGSVAMAGTALADRGISMAEVRDAFRRRGRAGVAELLGRRTIDVSLTGDEARAVLAGGLGQDIRIPDDQQWQVSVSAGGETVREGHRGVWGRVRGIPVVVENAETGEISISVDVDVIDQDIEVPEDLDVPAPPEPPAPPPPPAPPEPGDMFTPEQIDKALDKGLDDIANLGRPPRDLPGGPFVDVEVYDADGDGQPEAVGFDTDLDGQPDRVWIPGRGAISPGDPGWDETMPGGKPVPEPEPLDPPGADAGTEPPPEEEVDKGGPGDLLADVEEGAVAPGAPEAAAAAEAAKDAGDGKSPAAPKFHGSQAAETGASDNLNDPTLRGGATVWHDDYLDWLKQVEQTNPGATPQQILAALHAEQYEDDLARTVPGSDVPIFRHGPETNGYENVRIPTRHAPQFVLGPNGERIHIGHTYAGPRSDMNRSVAESLKRDWFRWANTHGGDSWQETVGAPAESWKQGAPSWGRNWAPPDQRRGNTVGEWLADFYREPKNKDVPLSEAMRRTLRGLNWGTLDQQGQ